MFGGEIDIDPGNVSWERKCQAIQLGSIILLNVMHGRVIRPSLCAD